MMLPTSAMVSPTCGSESFGWIKRMSLILRSRGKLNDTLPTLTLEPVVSDIYEATLCTT